MVNIKELRDLIDLIRDTDVVEVEVERAGSRVRIRRELEGRGTASSPPFLGHAAPPLPVPAVGGPAPAAEAPAAAPAALPENVALVRAPLVGRFYRSPGPEAAPYVEVGDLVKKGQVLCIIEAMKLMNEIEAEQAGKVRAVLVENARPVEYGEPLFELERVEAE